MEWHKHNAFTTGLAQRTFDRAAAHYEGAAALEAEVAGRLLERLAAVRHPPARIVDLGCGTGRDAVALKKRFPKAEVIGLDCSAMMARVAARQRRIVRAGLARPLKVLRASLGQLPLADQSVDLIYSNMSLHWLADSESLLSLFAEWRRVLRPGGMLLLSTLGPDTFLQLRRALQPAADAIARFPDIQSIGDQLQAAGFADPVADSEAIDLSYAAPRQMFSELSGNGALAMLGEARAIEGEFLLEWKEVNGPGPCVLGYEVIYAIAFGPQDGQPRKTPEGDVATFSVASLRKTARPN